jgi:hypothetical protein
MKVFDEGLDFEPYASSVSLHTYLGFLCRLFFRILWNILLDHGLLRLIDGSLWFRYCNGCNYCNAVFYLLHDLECDF